MTYLEGVYWDLDGTIANTELEAHLPAFNCAFLDFDLPWKWNTQEYINLLKINGGKNRISYYSKIVNFNLSENLIKQIHKKKQSYYLEFIRNKKINLKSGVYRLIKELHENNVRQFIVTSSSRVQVELLVNTFFQEINPFEFFISSDDVQFHKPNPYPYLKAMDLSGIKNTKSIVFEDSNQGIRSSMGAKLPTIYFPSNIPTVLDNDLNLDCIIFDLGNGKNMANIYKGPKINSNHVDYFFLNKYLSLNFHAKD